MLVLPFVALLALGLINTAAVLRDVLLLHEAARVGARAAATTVDNQTVADAARDAAPELPGVRVAVSPPQRATGDVVTVTVSAARRVGPTSLLLRAKAHARVEPAVGAGLDGHPWWRPGGQGAAGPVLPWRSDGWKGLADRAPRVPGDGKRP